MVLPRKLAKKPLSEAILEVRWALEPGPVPETRRDPHYKFLLGPLFAAVKDNYPHHEELPAASVPDEMTPNVVHHRFRASPGGWPLLQVGPGIFVVNETVDYEWERFERQINEAIHALFAAHPKPEALAVDMLGLRYINTIPMDFEKINVLEFLSKKMKTSIILPPSIFGDVVSATPFRLSSEFAFPSKKPLGLLVFRFRTGRKGPDKALLFELQFISRGNHIPSMPKGFSDWAEQAHSLIEASFFKLIEGDLEKEFSANA